MVQTVYDAAAELQAIAGKDAEDPATDAQPATLPDYVAALDADALDGARVGVLADLETNATNDVYNAAKDVLADEGATLVEVAWSPPGAGPGILNYEFKRDLNAYLARLGPNAPVKSLAEVIAFNLANPVEAIRLGMNTLQASQAIDIDDPTTKAQYEANRDNGRAITRGYIDGLLTRGTPDESDDLDALFLQSGTSTGTGARAGYPQLAVPAGYRSDTGNPVSIGLQGTAYAEAELLALGYAFEQATRARRAPSETNPASWRCVPGSAFAPRSCAP
jgi:amidase